MNLTGIKIGMLLSDVKSILKSRKISFNEDEIDGDAGKMKLIEINGVSLLFKNNIFHDWV